VAKAIGTDENIVGLKEFERLEPCAFLTFCALPAGMGGNNKARK